MKKTTLSILALSTLATTSLLGADYGYREYLSDKQVPSIAFDNNSTGYISYAPASNTAFIYCAIQGGNVVIKATSEMGTQEYQAFNEDDIKAVQAMSKDERIAKYGRGHERLRLQMDKDFKKYIAMDRAQGRPMMAGNYECRLSSGETTFKLHQNAITTNTELWVVEHNNEPISEYTDFRVSLALKDSNYLGATEMKGPSKELYTKINNNYKDYNSFFDDWDNSFITKRLKNKIGDNYSFQDNFTFNKEHSMRDSMAELAETEYFCEAKGGNFIKGDMPFREFLKQYYLKGYAANPATFEGEYTCENTPDSFTLNLKGYYHDAGSYYKMYSAVVKKGIHKQAVTPIPKEGTLESLDAMQKKYILNTSSDHHPHSYQIGLETITSIFDGNDEKGCDLVSLEKHIKDVHGSSKMFKYRVCNKEISLR